MNDEDIVDFEPEKIDENIFARKINQTRLSKHEMDDLFLSE